MQLVLFCLLYVFEVFKLILKGGINVEMVLLIEYMIDVSYCKF